MVGVAGRRELAVATIPESARAVLESGSVAHLVTLNPDGSPQVTCIWVGIEDGEIVFASLARRQKIHNIARDPRVVLSVETTHKNQWGLLEYVVVHGRGRIEAGGAPEMLQRLARTYLGPDVPYPPMPNPPPGFVVRIAVDRVSGVGPWRGD